MWNEGHGDLFIEDRPVMQHRMFTPLQLPELFDALEGFGIRLVRKPVMVYSSQGIRNAHVKVFQMLEDQLGRNLSTRPRRRRTSRRRRTIRATHRPVGVNSRRSGGP